MSLIPILNEGRAGFEKYESMVNQFGPSIGGAADAEMKYKESTEKLSLALDKLKMSATPLLGLLTSLTAHAADALNFDSTATKAEILKDKLKGLIDLAVRWETLNQISMDTGTSKSANQNKPESFDLQKALLTQQKALTAELNAQAQDLFETLKAGGPAERALADAQQHLNEVIKAGAEMLESKPWPSRKRCLASR